MTRDEQYIDLCRRLEWYRGGRPSNRRDLMIRSFERQIADLTRYETKIAQKEIRNV